MTALAHTWRKVTRRGGTAQTTEASEEVAATISTVEAPSVEIAPNDPLVAFLQSAGGAVDVESPSSSSRPASRHFARPASRSSCR